MGRRTAFVLIKLSNSIKVMVTAVCLFFYRSSAQLDRMIFCPLSARHLVFRLVGKQYRFVDSQTEFMAFVTKGHPDIYNLFIYFTAWIALRFLVMINTN